MIRSAKRLVRSFKSVLGVHPSSFILSEGFARRASATTSKTTIYYCLAALGRKSESISTQLVALLLRVLPLPERVRLLIDDSPTKRYGPKVEGADVHHNPTPGPADQPYLSGHIWVTISLALRHPEWGSLALPLRAMQSECK